MSKNILFLSPETFSGKGGIQRMSSIMVYLLWSLGKKNDWNIKLNSLNDHADELTNPYLPSSCFSGFNRNKTMFTLRSLMNGMKANIIILAHVNLSLLGIFIRILNPGCKIWLIAHGIEVWRPLQYGKKLIWTIADRFICVSNHTKNKVIALHRVNPKCCTVLNNIPDPFLKLPQKFNKPNYLLKRYGLKGTEKVILTLSRISASEQFKGYDKVFKAISSIKTDPAELIYLLAGPCDKNERKRIDQLILTYNLQKNVILTGYIEESELVDHYLLADLFVLPSVKEGFGIVFVEAMGCGLPVICGNRDGSADAVRHHLMGTCIDPHDLDALELAIRKRLHQNLKPEDRKAIQKECMQHFNSQQYCLALTQLINNETVS